MEGVVERTSTGLGCRNVQVLCSANVSLLQLYSPSSGISYMEMKSRLWNIVMTAKNIVIFLLTSFSA
jgi:hypothetical protein